MGGTLVWRGAKKGGQRVLEWRETKRLCMKTKLKIVGFLFLFPGDFWPFGIYYVMKLSYLRLRKGLFQLSLFKLLRFWLLLFLLFTLQQFFLWFFLKLISSSSWILFIQKTKLNFFFQFNKPAIVITLAWYVIVLSVGDFLFFLNNDG